MGPLDYNYDRNEKGESLVLKQTKLETESIKKMLNTKQATLFDQDRQSTMYYLKPGTSSIYLLNLDKSEF